MDFTINPIVPYLAFGFLLMALLFAFFRIVRGPSVNDRVAALDLCAAIIMGFVLVYSIVVKKAIYFDIAIVISLISFIGTVAISTYLRSKS